MAVGNSGNLDLGTTGQVYVYNASGAPTPTNPELVGSDILLATYTASSSASIDLTSVISATYNRYRLVLMSLVAQTANDDLRLFASTNNGSSFDTGSNYTYITDGRTIVSTEAVRQLGAVSDTKITLALSVDTTNICSGIIEICPNHTIATMYGQLLYGCTTATAGFVAAHVAATYSSTLNALQLKFSSGNIVSGTVKLYAYN